MSRGSLWIVGVASVLQLLILIGVVLFSASRNEPVPVQIVYVSIFGGLTAGVLSSGWNRPHAGEGTWLVGDAIVHGSLAALLATITMFVVQFFSNVLNVWLQQGFWAPLVIGVYQGTFFALHLVSAVFLGSLGAIVGHWVANLVGPRIEATR